MGASKQSLDFTNVKEGGGAWNKKRLPEGDHRARITKVQDGKSKKSGEAMWIYTVEVKHRGQVGTYAVYIVLKEDNLWKLRLLFAAAGIVIPKKRMSVDPNRIVGREIGVTLEDSEYNGRLQSEIATMMPVSEVATAETDADQDEDEDEDEATDEEESEDEETSDDEEEEEEEEEEPEPAPKKKAAAKKAAAPAPKKKRAVQDDDLEELDLEDV
jgi:hypothetical protein